MTSRNSDKYYLSDYYSKIGRIITWDVGFTNLLNYTKYILKVHNNILDVSSIIK